MSLHASLIRTKTLARALCSAVELMDSGLALYAFRFCKLPCFSVAPSMDEAIQVLIEIGLYVICKHV